MGKKKIVQRLAQVVVFSVFSVFMMVVISGPLLLCVYANCVTVPRIIGNAIAVTLLGLFTLGMLVASAYFGQTYKEGMADWRNLYEEHMAGWKEQYSELREVAERAIRVAEAATVGGIQATDQLAEVRRSKEELLRKHAMELQAMRPAPRRPAGRPKAETMPPTAKDYGLDTADKFYTFLAELRAAKLRKDGSYTEILKSHKPHPVPESTARTWLDKYPDPPA